MCLEQAMFAAVAVGAVTHFGGMFSFFRDRPKNRTSLDQDLTLPQLFRFKKVLLIRAIRTGPQI